MKEKFPTTTKPLLLLKNLLLPIYFAFWGFAFDRFTFLMFTRQNVKWMT